MAALQKWKRPTGWLCQAIQRNYSSAIGTERWKRQDRNVVLIDGVRTPFMVAGTTYSVPEMDALEMARRTLTELHKKTGVPMDVTEYVVFGNVVSDLTTNNIARNATLVAGYPPSVPSHTVNMACMSSMQSITSCVAQIKASPINVCVAAGTDFMSDLPIRLPLKIRRALIKARRVKSPWQKMMMVAKSSLTSLIPDIPYPKEYISGEFAAVSAQRLGMMMGITRQEQDEYAYRSHMLAAKAFDEGRLTDVIPIHLESRNQTLSRDNGIRNCTVEQLSKLKPAFPKSAPNPTLTAGNSTFASDGASACILMTEERAKAMGLKPKAYIRDFHYVAQSPLELPMSGEVFAIPDILDRNGLKMSDIDVWELLEDFAAQVVANFKAMDSDLFAQKYMNRSEKVGAPPLEKVNAWGGSLAIGHPFSASGVRKLMHAANRLIAEDKQLACISGCAIGGQGSAIIVERHPDS